MVVTSVNNLFLDVSRNVTDTTMVVVEVALTDVLAGAGVSRRDRGAMLQDVECSVKVDDRIAGRARVMSDLLDRLTNGLERDVFMTIVTSKPTDEITHVEVEDEKGRG